MSTFDDPTGAMPPPDEDDGYLPRESGEGSGQAPEAPDGPVGVPAGAPAEDSAEDSAEDWAEDSAEPSSQQRSSQQPWGTPPEPTGYDAPAPPTPFTVGEPDELLDRRVVVYWLLSGLISWGFMALFIGGGATFVYLQAVGSGDDASGWGTAWNWVLPVAVGMLGILLLWTLIAPPLAYARWRFAVDRDLLLARYGILFIEEKAIPISRLQHVDLYRGFLERLFGLATLIVFTAGTEGAHFRLPGLSLARARELRDLIIAARGDDVI
jgi:hypothetical protein